LTSREAKERLIVALDLPDQQRALDLVTALGDHVGFYKIGLELFCAGGPAVVEAVLDQGVRVFLDLKFHDIPNTVARASARVSGMGVHMFNVHAAGGREMMEAAVRAVTAKGGVGSDSDLVAGCRRERGRPLVLGVTVLTSIDARVFSELGIEGEVLDRVVAWARLAQDCGLDGVVASPGEVRAIRQSCGDDFLIVTPGIRPEWAARGDQRRRSTPAEALRNGADFLVVGRPVTQSPDPVAAVERILAEMEGA